MKKTILSLNCGSSSLKYNLFEVKDDNTVEPIIGGISEEIGNLERSTMKFEMNGEKTKYSIELPDHEDALVEMFNIFEKQNVPKETIIAIGHRVVHGGASYNSSVMLTDEVISEIDKLSPLAPLHNPQNLKGILVAEKLLPGIPNVAVFDTAFHSTIPEFAFKYALPEKWFTDYQVRRYGFHGTSHLYVSRRAAVLLGMKHDEINCVTAHMGNGSSLTKVVNGKSCDTSMGFTPLEGVIMGTRSGDMDPAIIGHIAHLKANEENMELGEAYDEVMRILNKDSGLKGLSGTNLMQDIRAKALEGDEFSDRVVDIYAYRLAKYIGSYMLTSDRCDAIIFTAGVGENEWYVRQKVLGMLEGCNFVIDEEANRVRGEEIVIAEGVYNGSKISVMVIPTDEEVVIAYDTLFIGALGLDAPENYPFEKGKLDMAYSLALVIIVGLIANWLFEKIKLPGLLGMLVTGIIMGPWCFDLLSADFMAISGDFRKIALIIILLRAGLGLRKEVLQKVGGAALRLSIIPCLLEGGMIIAIAMILFDFTLIEAGLMGFIIAAVSPAVVVPAMLDYQRRGIGAKKGIPTMILAGASVDDIFAITLFSAFLGMYAGKSINFGAMAVTTVISIVAGIILGVAIGFIFIYLFKKLNIRDTKKVLLILGAAILMTAAEDFMSSIIQISSLLGIMTVGFILLEKLPIASERLAVKFGKIWIFAEILLFVLIGARVNIDVLFDSGLKGLLIVFAGLSLRSVGVLLSLIKTNLNMKEKLFCIISYIPKATVQAAIGAVPLALGIPGGEIILAVAVLSIAVTAPLGSIGIRLGAKKLLVEGNE